MGDFANSLNTNNRSDPKDPKMIGNNSDDQDTGINTKALSYKDAYSSTDTPDPEADTQQKTQLYVTSTNEVPGFFIKKDETKGQQQQEYDTQEIQDMETVPDQLGAETTAPLENGHIEETIETIASPEIGEKPKQYVQNPTSSIKKDKQEMPQEQEQEQTANIIDLTTPRAHTTPLKETIDTITAYADKEEEEFIENVKTAHASQ